MRRPVQERHGVTDKKFDGELFKGKVEDFDAPTKLPDDEDQRRRWQAANRSWWEHAPMRYDWREDIAPPAGSLEYFAEVDRRFWASVRHYLPWRRVPFDTILDFDTLADKDVLEIGVGQGSHAGLIAPRCRSYTGIDLTEYATSMTRKRLALHGIKGNVIRMDAETMAFPDSSFDFIWSWGVIHHSADTLAILREMQRVLRPGGRATVMVYYRSVWKYHIMDGFLNGVVRGQFRRLKGIHRVSQASTDGAIARYFTMDEWRRLCQGVLDVKSMRVTGHKTDVIPLPAGRMKDVLVKHIPDQCTRFMTDKVRCGSFLIAELGII